MSDDLFEKARQELAAEHGVDLSAPEPAAEVPEDQEEGGVWNFIKKTGRNFLSSGIPGATAAAQLGGANAILETKDFLLGEPEEGEKSEVRKTVEGLTEDFRSIGTTQDIAVSVAQFGAGFVGAGKVMGPVKAVQKLKAAGTAGRTAYEIGRGAAAGAVVIDPHEERLSDLIQSYPALENPVTEFLASDPEDSAAMGRFKNALEGIGLDLALVGILGPSLKALGHFRKGDNGKGLKELKKVEKATKALDEQAASSANAKPVPTDRTSSAQNALSGDPGVKEGQSAASISPVKSEAAAVPARKQKIRVTETNVEDIVKGAQEDAAAIKRYGSREEALAQGHKFSGADINWKQVRSTEDVNALAANTAKVLKKQMDKAKGGATMPDAKVRDMVRESAELFGEDPDAQMGVLVRAGENATTMAADMEASFILTRKMFEGAHEVATKINAGVMDEWGGDATKAAAELRRRFKAGADMMASGMAMRSSAGRSLRRNRREFAIKPEDIEAFDQIPDEKLVDVIFKSKGDLKKLKEATNPSFWRRVMDESTFLLTNNLLWHWPTHLVNTTTNMYMLGARPMEKLIGSVAQGSHGSAVRRQAIKEYAYLTHSLGDAWSGMVDAFLKGDSTIAPHTDEYFQSGSRVNAPKIEWRGFKSTWDLFYNGVLAANYKDVAAAAGTAGAGAYRTTVGLPTRALGSLDEFVKVMRYRSVVQARAAVEASDAGLRGADVGDHIQRRLTEAFDDAGRAVDDAALQEAKTVTFQNELLPGTIGKGVQNFRHNVPATALILPFVKTPVNVLRYAWKMTPGLNLLQTEYRTALRGASGAEAQAHAIGQMAIGSTFMMIAANMAMAGRLTGAGPSDPKVKNELLATGWQPYSVVFNGEDGKKTYFPIGRFDPVGLPFGMVADLVDIMVLHPDKKEAERGATAIGVALAKAFSEKTFLMNINQAMRAMTEPDKNMSKFLGNLHGNMIPGSSAIKNYANSDPYLRDARGYLDNAMKNLPGYSETLPPRRDAFGEPVWRKRGLMTDQKVDVVEEEHNRIIAETGQGLRPPAPRRMGIDLRDVVLSDGRNAYDLMQELSAKPNPNGRSLKEALKKLITSDGYQTLVDGDPTLKGTKLHQIARVVRQYRSAAFNVMKKKYPELRKALHAQQIDVKNAVEENRSRDKGRPTGEDLLRSLGY